MYADSWRVVLAAAALALAAVATWEGYLRDAGYRPNFVNLHDEVRRRQWDAMTPDSAVVLGSSEIMAALDLEALAKGTRRKVVSLARFGTPPDLALEKLAKREDFHGLVIVSFTPGYFRAAWATSMHAVGVPVLVPDEPSPSARVHTDLSFHANRLLRFRSRTFVLSSMVDAVLDGGWRGDWQAMNERLEWLIDYSNPANAEHDRKLVLSQLGRVGPPVPQADVDQAIERLAPTVAAIERRGGKVVFVTLHVSAEVAARTAIPREQGWDRLCRGTKAHCIHADDHPVMRRWQPGDGFHLDINQRTDFTRTFSEVLCTETAACGR
jgi:hypothetical protein